MKKLKISFVPEDKFVKQRVMVLEGKEWKVS